MGSLGSPGMYAPRGSMIWGPPCNGAAAPNSSAPALGKEGAYDALSVRSVMIVSGVKVLRALRIIRVLGALSIFMVN